MRKEEKGRDGKVGMRGRRKGGEVKGKKERKEYDR